MINELIGAKARGSMSPLSYLAAKIPAPRGGVLYDRARGSHAPREP